MASANVDTFNAYCKKCGRIRRFHSVKLRASGYGGSVGMPTKYICSKNHVYETRPPKYPPRKKRRSK